MECGEKRMPSSFGTPSQVGHCIQPRPLKSQGSSRAAGKETAAGRASHPRPAPSHLPPMGRPHSPAQGPTRLVYAHPASAPPRGAPSRYGPAAAAEWRARGAAAAPGRAEPGLRNPSPALRPAWPGQSLPPLSTARPWRSSPRLPPAAQTGCAGRQQGEPQSERHRAVPARSTPPGPARSARATA